MRQITVVVILAIARPGCADSAAATVVISAPVRAKNTVATAASTAIQPRGVKPPLFTRFAKVAPEGDVQPKAKEAAITMNTNIAATLMEANQNSNSAYERADIRLTPVMMVIKPRPICSCEKGSQCCRIFAPAMASTGTTMTQKYQYGHPTTKPAPSPRPQRANSVNERTLGSAVAISPSMRITRRMSMPVMAALMNTA